MPNNDRGSMRHNAKLDECKVVAIRRLYSVDQFSLTEIAQSCGVGKTAVACAISGSTWSHVPGAVRLRPGARKPVRMLAVDGDDRPLRVWCRLYGKSFSLVQKRLNAGWEPVDALSTENLGRGGRR